MLNNRYLSLTLLLTLESPASNRLQCLTNESQDTFEEPFTMVSTGEITDVFEKMDGLEKEFASFKAKIESIQRTTQVESVSRPSL